jgi:hypothetical protein
MAKEAGLNPRPGPDLESVRETLRAEDEKMESAERPGKRRWPPRRSWLTRAGRRFRRRRRTS